VLIKKNINRQPGRSTVLAVLHRGFDDAAPSVV
jgi:hypothetical protein